MAKDFVNTQTGGEGVTAQMGDLTAVDRKAQTDDIKPKGDNARAIKKQGRKDDREDRRKDRKDARADRKEEGSAEVESTPVAAEEGAPVEAETNALTESNIELDENAIEGGEELKANIPLIAPLDDYKDDGREFSFNVPTKEEAEGEEAKEEDRPFRFSISAEEDTPSDGLTSLPEGVEPFSDEEIFKIEGRDEDYVRRNGHLFTRTPNQEGFHEVSGKDARARYKGFNASAISTKTGKLAGDGGYLPPQTFKPTVGGDTIEGKQVFGFPGNLGWSYMQKKNSLGEDVWYALEPGAEDFKLLKDTKSKYSEAERTIALDKYHGTKSVVSSKDNLIYKNGKLYGRATTYEEAEKLYDLGYRAEGQDNVSRGGLKSLFATGRPGLDMIKPDSDIDKKAIRKEIEAGKITDESKVSKTMDKAEIALSERAMKLEEDTYIDINDDLGYDDNEEGAGDNLFVAENKRPESTVQLMGGETSSPEQAEWDKLYGPKLPPTDEDVVYREKKVKELNKSAHSVVEDYVESWDNENAESIVLREDAPQGIVDTLKDWNDRIIPEAEEKLENTVKKYDDLSESHKNRTENFIEGGEAPSLSEGFDWDKQNHGMYQDNAAEIFQSNLANLHEAVQEKTDRELQAFIDRDLNVWAENANLSDEQISYLESLKNRAKLQIALGSVGSTLKGDVEDYIASARQINNQMAEALASGQDLTDYLLDYRKSLFEEASEKGLVSQEVSDVFKSTMNLRDYMSEMIKDGSVEYDEANGKYSIAKNVPPTKRAFIEQKMEVLLGFYNTATEKIWTDNTKVIDAKNAEIRSIRASIAKIKQASNMALSLGKEVEVSKKDVEQLNSYQEQIKTIESEIKELKNNSTITLQTDPYELGSELANNMSKSAYSIFSAIPKNVTGYQKFALFYKNLDEKTRLQANKLGMDYSKRTLDKFKDVGILHSLGVKLSSEEIEFYENAAMLRQSRPIIFNNDWGVTKESATFWSHLDNVITNFMAPTTAGAYGFTSGTGNASGQLRMMEQAGLTADEYADGDTIDKYLARLDVDFFSMEGLANLVGPSLAIMGGLGTGGILMGKGLKVGKGLLRLLDKVKLGTKGSTGLNATKNFNMIKDSFTTSIQASRTGRFLYSSAKQGVQFEAGALMMNEKARDQLNFFSGMFGAMGAKVALKVLGKVAPAAAIEWLSGIFGGSTKKATSLFIRIGKSNWGVAFKAAHYRGLGEIPEEFSQELISIYRDELRKRGFFEEVLHRYVGPGGGNLSNLEELAFASYFLGMAMGTALSSSQAKYYDAVPPSRRKAFNDIIKSGAKDIIIANTAQDITAEKIANNYDAAVDDLTKSKKPKETPKEQETDKVSKEATEGEITRASSVEEAQDLWDKGYRIDGISSRGAIEGLFASGRKGVDMEMPVKKTIEDFIKSTKADFQEFIKKAKEEGLTVGELEAKAKEEGTFDNDIDFQGLVEYAKENNLTIDEVIEQVESIKVKKSLADSIREGKLGDDITYSSIIPKSVINAAIEITAKGVEAIETVIENVKNSKWYTDLKAKNPEKTKLVDAELEQLRDDLQNQADSKDIPEGLTKNGKIDADWAAQQVLNTAPGNISSRQVLALYKKYIDPGFSRARYESETGAKLSKGTSIVEIVYNNFEKHSPFESVSDENVRAFLEAVGVEIPASPVKRLNPTEAVKSIKERIAQFRTGYLKGGKDQKNLSKEENKAKKEAIEEIQNELLDYARKNLLTGVKYNKTDITSLMKKIREAKSTKDLNSALEAIDKKVAKFEEQARQETIDNIIGRFNDPLVKTRGAKKKVSRVSVEARKALRALAEKIVGKPANNTVTKLSELSEDLQNEHLRLTKEFNAASKAERGIDDGQFGDSADLFFHASDLRGLEIDSESTEEQINDALIEEENDLFAREKSRAKEIRKEHPNITEVALSEEYINLRKATRDAHEAIENFESANGIDLSSTNEGVNAEDVKSLEDALNDMTQEELDALSESMDGIIKEGVDAVTEKQEQKSEDRRTLRGLPFEVLSKQNGVKALKINGENEIRTFFASNQGAIAYDGQLFTGFNSFEKHVLAKGETVDGIGEIDAAMVNTDKINASLAFRKKGSKLKRAKDVTKQVFSETASPLANKLEWVYKGSKSLRTWVNKEIIDKKAKAFRDKANGIKKKKAFLQEGIKEIYGGRGVLDPKSRIIPKGWSDITDVTIKASNKPLTKGQLLNAYMMSLSGAKPIYEVDGVYFISPKKAQAAIKAKLPELGPKPTPEQKAARKKELEEAMVESVFSEKWNPNVIRQMSPVPNVSEGELDVAAIEKAIEIENAIKSDKKLDATLSLLREAYDSYRVDYEPMFEDMYDLEFKEGGTYFPLSSSNPVEPDINVLSNPSFNNAATAMSNHLKQRHYNSTSTIDFGKDALAKTLNYVAEMEHAKNFIPVTESFRALMNPVTKMQLIEKIGAQKVKMLEEHMNVIIDDGAKVTDMGTFLKTVTSYTVITTLAGKLASIPKQMTSFLHYYGAGLDSGVGVRKVSYQTLRLIGSIPGFSAAVGGATIESLVKGQGVKGSFDAKAIGPLSENEVKVLKQAMYDAFISDRISNVSIDLETKALMEDMMASDGKAFLQKISKWAMSTTVIGDMSAVLLGGLPFTLATYNNNIKNKDMGHEEAMSDALDKFVDVSEHTQQSRRTDVLSNVQRSPAYRIFMTYTTSQVAVASKINAGVKVLKSWKNNSKDPLTGETEYTPKEAFNAFRKVIYYATLGNGLFNVVSGGYLGMLALGYKASDDDDDVEIARKKDLVKTAYWDASFDTLSSVLQGYGVPGRIIDAMFNNARGREFFNDLPIIKRMELLAESGTDMGTLWIDALGLYLNPKPGEEITEGEFFDILGGGYDRTERTQENMIEIAGMKNLFKLFESAGQWMDEDDGKDLSAWEAFMGRTIGDDENDEPLDDVYTTGRTRKEQAAGRGKNAWIYETLFPETYIDTGAWVPNEVDEDQESMLSSATDEWEANNEAMMSQEGDYLDGMSEGDPADTEFVDELEFKQEYRNKEEILDRILTMREWKENEEHLESLVEEEYAKANGAGEGEVEEEIEASEEDKEKEEFKALVSDYKKITGKDPDPLWGEDRMTRELVRYAVENMPTKKISEDEN